MSGEGEDRQTSLTGTQILAVGENGLRVLWVDERGFVATRTLDDRRFLAVVPQLFGAGLLTMTNPGAFPGTWDEGYTYERLADAVDALESWDPAETFEPLGWIRHRPSNRRRSGGDPREEYVRE